MNIIKTHMSHLVRDWFTDFKNTAGTAFLGIGFSSASINELASTLSLLLGALVFATKLLEMWGFKKPSTPKKK